MIHFTEVTSEQEIADVSSLAQEIWQEHYLPIIGQKQIDYMLEKFQSKEAIKTQLSDGYKYYIVNDNKHFIAYLAVLPNIEGSSLMISKFYVKKSERGFGVGKQMLKFIEALSFQQKINKIWLTVNKYNQDTIASYLHMGFIDKRSIVQDIGGGFIMDDLLMEKCIGS